MSACQCLVAFLTSISPLTDIQAFPLLLFPPHLSPPPSPSIRPPNPRDPIACHNMLRSEQERRCTVCDRTFKRAQELRRHLKEKHEPWRRCPFCKFEWTRPDKIKLHITTYHRDRFATEVMADFRALYGKKVVAFLDGFDHRPRPRADMEGLETAPALRPPPSPPRDSPPP